MTKKATLETIAEDIAYIKEHMATKADIENLAMSTAGSFAHKAEDLQNTEDRLSQKLNGLGNRTERVEDDIRKVKTALKMN